MSAGNVSFIKDFVIVGFPGLHSQYHGLVSALLFFVYVFILVGNAVFFSLFLMTKSLKKPVYYLIINLVVCDVLFSTTTLPKIISRYLFQDGSISFLGCFVQMFFVHYFGSVCSLILLAMAIDRYAAICYPLQYHSIMTNRNVLILLSGSWIVGLLGPLGMVIRAYPLPYCAENTIIHCYCDHFSITTLACTDRSLYGIPALVYAFVIHLVPFAIIIFSYCSIFVAVMRISGNQGKMKTFSTCSPQLIIIVLYFLPRCFNYLATNIGLKFSTDMRLLMVMMYSLLPPMINPLIYFLRTEEVKKILKRTFQRKQILYAFLYSCIEVLYLIRLSNCFYSHNMLYDLKLAFWQCSKFFIHYVVFSMFEYGCHCMLPSHATKIINMNLPCCKWSNQVVLTGGKC